MKDYFLDLELLPPVPTGLQSCIVTLDKTSFNVVRWGVGTVAESNFFSDVYSFTWGLIPHQVRSQDFCVGVLT